MWHMIKEPARHSGHANLLRETIEGMVGEYGVTDPDGAVCRTGLVPYGPGPDPVHRPAEE